MRNLLGNHKSSLVRWRVPRNYGCLRHSTNFAGIKLRVTIVELCNKLIGPLAAFEITQGRAPLRPLMVRRPYIATRRRMTACSIKAIKRGSSFLIPKLTEQTIQTQYPQPKKLSAGTKRHLIFQHSTPYNYKSKVVLPFSFPSFHHKLLNRS